MMLDVTQEAQLLARTLALRSARRVVINLVTEEESELERFKQLSLNQPSDFHEIHLQKRKVERLRRVLYQIDAALK
jgi:hypothetical protein